jgi:Cu/Ag efflux pump CusA
MLKSLAMKFMMTVFEAGGNRWWWQLLAATLIGALLPLSMFLRSNEYMQHVSIPAVMLGFGGVGFIVGSGLILREFAEIKIQRQQEAGRSARGWKFVRNASVIFLVLFAVLALCLSMLMWSGVH